VETILFAISLVGGLLFVLVPLVRRPTAALPSSRLQRLQELEKEKRRLLGLMRDLEFDRQVGKVLPEDYEASFRELKAEVIRIMREMDELLPQERLEEMAEAEIRSWRRRLAREGA
jgi:hypothetical protein